MDDSVVFTENSGHSESVTYRGKVSPMGRSSEREIYLNKIQSLFGFSDADIFKNSLFIEQRSLNVLPSQQTASEIKHLISNISEFKYDEVIHYLEEKYFELTKKNPGGTDKRNDRLLEEVQKQIQDLEQRIERAHMNQDSLQMLAQKIGDHRENLKTKESRLKLITKSIAALEQLSRLSKKEMELKESLTDLQKRKALVDRLQMEFEDLLKRKPEPNRIWFGGLITTSLILLILSFTTSIHWMWMVLGLGMTSAILGYFFITQKKSLETFELQETRIKGQLEVLPKLNQLTPSIDQRTSALTEVQAQKTVLSPSVIDSQKTMPQALQDQNLEKETLEDQIEKLKETYLFEKQNYVVLAKGLESPYSLEEDLYDLKQKEKFLRTKAKALWTAKELLSQMVIEFRKEHLKLFAKDAKAHFEAVVPTAYGEFGIDENVLSPSVQVHNQPISIGSLSCGTQDQLYFSLKLSLLSILSSGRKLPLFLDDPFVNFDHERRLKALELLKKLSLEHQIFLFTYDPWYCEHLQNANVISLDTV